MWKVTSCSVTQKADRLSCQRKGPAMECWHKRVSSCEEIDPHSPYNSRLSTAYTRCRHYTEKLHAIGTVLDIAKDEILNARVVKGPWYYKHSHKRNTPKETGSSKV